MKIEEKWVYPASDTDVYAMIVDPAFQEAKCAATKAVDFGVQIDPTDKGHTIVSRRTMSTSSFPSQFKSMVGDTLQIIETQVWGAPDAGGSRAADLTVEIKGAPIGMTGTLRATASGSDTVMQLEGDLKARVPLIGGKIEQAAAPAIVAAIHTEADTGNAYLGN